MSIFSKNENPGLVLDENGYIKIEDKKLISWNEENGNGCIASDKITKEGYKVGYMYRENPTPNMPDSGWRFLAGNEDEEYMNNSKNHHVFAINTICNYDSDIIPYLKADFGSSFIRVDNDKFELDDETREIFIKKQTKN